MHVQCGRKLKGSVLCRIFSRHSEGGEGLGRINNHIKALMLHPLEDQRELLAEGPQV